MSWKPMVKTVNDPKFYGNALRFATAAEAEASAQSLAMRWSAVEEWTVHESPDPVNRALDLETGEERHVDPGPTSA